MDISVIVPCFNALGKIERCLSSLQSMSLGDTQHEVIFVDDCSTDGTFEYLQEQAKVFDNWSVLQLDANSGSPSKPRNVGVEHAKGSYVFFLDCDDEILIDTLHHHFSHAVKTDACIVRGYLLADDGCQQKSMNKILGWNEHLSHQQKIEKIIGQQSTTVPNLIKTNIIRDNHIAWPEHIRVGEDSLFLVDVLTHSVNVEYIEHPTFIYNKRASFRASSTQEYGSRELNNHLIVWREMLDVLAVYGVDYAKIRLHVGLQTAIQGLIYKNKSDIDIKDFNRFSDFVRSQYDKLQAHKFSSHISQVLDTLSNVDYAGFIESCKPRLLINGHDLKFIKPTIHLLERYFKVKVDEWSGHNNHDEAKSNELLEWADYIWCEWLLGNAQWYAKRKKPHQKLVVRMHRFELSRDFGKLLNIDNVDRIVAVSVLFFERLLERFPNIPREKARLIHNYVDIDGYKQSDFKLNQFNIGIIGIVPSRKGFRQAIEVLKQLKKHDERYRLKVFGTAPSEIAWLKNHQDEIQYYEECETEIAKHGLTDSIDMLGHCNIKQELANQQVGYVLSLSENSKDFPGPESFHLAIADGFASGALSLILRWDGCEYIYPEKFISDSVQDITDKILSYASQPDDYESDVGLGKTVMRSHYSIDEFVEHFLRTFNEI